MAQSTAGLNLDDHLEHQIGGPHGDRANWERDGIFRLLIDSRHWDADCNLPKPSPTVGTIAHGPKRGVSA
jgi:hypothetical protein